MPAKRKKITKTTKSHKKQHPKHFLKVYWPYIPILAVVTFGMFFSNVNPKSSQHNQPATLAYATEMGTGALLNSTNAQRSSNGLGALTLNSKLNASAQAKANDMVARDYWAHNTPDGKEPWVFFDAAGYVYQKAGENLAYGFSSSDATVIGWMNSPSHRANILDTGYTEVGFGFANSANFVGTGQETIVVAHYGKPVTPAPAPAATPTSTPVSKPQSLPASTQAAPTETPAPVEEVKEEEKEPEKLAEDRYNQPVTSDTPVPDEKPSTSITRLQRLTGGDAPWSAFAVSAIAFTMVAVWLLKHAVLVKRYFWAGEHFAAHHPVLDLVVVSVAALAVYLSQSSGVVL
ncbi:CAP domain-containing protein [Candidatus Saccharibacteria bacterium]|nr:CAP domain-containing protein [Candidatus Saccharibacteria bacterium]